MINKKLLSMTLLIVEDNEISSKQLKETLSLYFEKIFVAVDGCDAIEKIKEFSPDIIISDIRMPCLDGIEMIKQVKSKTYKPIIIITTAFSDSTYLLDALDMKVDAYLIKPIDIHQLMKKIEESIGCVSGNDLRYKILSQREYEVFLDLAAGKKPSEIAQQYNIKAKTISTYRNRIFKKMAFNSNAELISYAIKNNLI
jgi:DNA-binding NarL/FixJ family response regulator